MNVWFLAIVAIWRVILYFRFLKYSARLSRFAIFIALLMPLVIIVACLTILNLEHVIFRLMAGLREDERTANDMAYFILIVITVFSTYVAPFLILGYIGLIIKKWRDSKKSSSKQVS
jgi:hypothetical protein